MKTLEWGDCRPVRKLTLLIASGFGLGLAPIASGTAGTLLGVVVVVGLPQETFLSQICLAVLLALIAVPVCDVAEKHFGNTDDGRIVADEYMTFPICVVALPWALHPWLLALAFVTHRFFDIVKPFPAYRAQRWEGGKGVVIDDVISSLYALAANHAVWWLANV